MRLEGIIFWGDAHSIRFRATSKIYGDLFLKLSPMLWDKIREGFFYWTIIRNNIRFTAQNQQIAKTGQFIRLHIVAYAYRVLKIIDQYILKQSSEASKSILTAVLPSE